MQPDHHDGGDLVARLRYGMRYSCTHASIGFGDKYILILSVEGQSNRLCGEKGRDVKNEEERKRRNT